MISGVKFEGFEAAQARLNSANILAAVKPALLATGQEAKNFMQEYPATTAANQPGRWSNSIQGTPHPLGYYERGRGEWYPIVRKSTLTFGSFGHYGKAAGRIKARGVEAKAGLVAGYKLGKTSERLREKWTIIQKPGIVIVTNAATYAKYVQGAKDQASVMAKIGWKTTQGCVEYLRENRIFQTAFYQALKARMASVTNITRTAG
jgi:hypothetical protein